MLAQLEDAAAQLGVRVSYEVLAASVGHGGLCRVKGEYRVIIDKRATPQERLTTLATALARVHATAATANSNAGTPVKLSPKVRELLEFHSTEARPARAAQPMRPQPSRRAS